LLDGIAIGGMLPVCWALNIEYAPKRYRSTIVTVIMIGYSLGITMAGPITVWLMPRFGWPAPFIFGGALSLLAALVLIGTLPESVRFLTSTGRRAEVIARIVRRIAPGRPVPAAAQFVTTDESDQGKDFQLSLLFKGELRWITPLLWIGYIFSSMAVFFFATWTPSVFEAVGFSRTAAALGASVNSFAGAVGGLLLMRFTDIRGAIAITVMPLVALPLLLAVGFVDLGYWPFLVIQALAAVFLIGGHFGLHSIAGIFYPSAYRGNGTGWAFSVAKVGSIAGPLIAGRLLSTNLPVRNIFAVVAICPAVLFVCMLVIGTLHTRLLREARAPPSAGYAPRKAGALAP
jgi:AAHS family 4-hydroxybenzoate transporter-like MFS transporter